ncbi:MAG TPA: VWA domain-containing protein, partial [Blastocatellia bacterium]
MTGQVLCFSSPRNAVGLVLTGSPRSSRAYVLSFPLLALIYLCLGASPALAQSGRARSDSQQDQPIRLRTEEVLVPISVQSDYGKLPDQLKASDLIVVEDNSRRAITSVMRSPANIVFVVDNCIEFGKFKDVNLNRTAAAQIIDAMGSDDKAAIVTYANKVNIISGFTTDKAALKLALSERFQLGSKSHLYDSLVYAAGELARLPGRHTVVVFTDGYDDFPKNALDQARQAFDRVRATVYVIDQSAMIAKAFKPAVSDKSLSNLMSLGVDSKYRDMVAEWKQYITDIQGEEKTMK